MTETAPGRIEIDIASDVVCPWCVIGWLQLERALADTGVPALVRWHPFELNPDMPPGGENLRAHIAAKYGTDAQASEESRARIAALGATLGFRFDFFPEMRIVNTFRAHRLLHWAGLEGRAHPLKMALFEAYFSERLDPDDPEVLLACAEAAGLDRAEAAAVLAEGRHAEAVRRIEGVWAENGISGVPAMVFQRRHVVTGAQGVEGYAAILARLAAAPAA